MLGAAFAFTHSAAALITLLAGNLFLMTHVFMVNDWAGLSGDLSDPNKAHAVFTAKGIHAREIVALAAGLLIVSLALFSWLSLTTVCIALAIAVLSALYSFSWKGKALLNSATHLAGGIFHFLLGYSIAHALDRRGLAIAVYFALIFVAGHLTQEVRDYAADVVNGIRTNAVTFGPRRTFVASLVLFASAHVIFLVLAFEKVIPPLLAPVVALFLIQVYWSLATLRDGLSYANVSRLQSRYRMLYAFIGGCIVVALLL